jgi:hypothetical protein
MYSGSTAPHLISYGAWVTCREALQISTGTSLAIGIKRVMRTAATWLERT